MKKKLLFLVLFLMLLSTRLVFAELYIIKNSATDEILTASEQNDTILEAGYELVVLPGGWSSYELSSHITNYKYTNKFKLNQAKIDAKDAEEAAKDAEKAQKELDKQSGKDKLKTAGLLTDAELEALFPGGE